MKLENTLFQKFISGRESFALIVKKNSDKSNIAFDLGPFPANFAKIFR